MRVMALCLCCLGMVIGAVRAYGLPTPAEQRHAFVQQVLDAAERARQTQLGVEQAFFVQTPDIQTALHAMMRPDDASAHPEQATRTLQTLLPLLDAARAWPKPLPLILPFAPGTPSLDGTLTDILWQTAAYYPGVFPLNHAVRTLTPRTNWRLMWDEKYLYVGVECEDEDVQDTDTPDQLGTADAICLYVLTDPHAGSYWQVAVSPSGACVCTQFQKRREAWGADAKPDAKLPTLHAAAQIDRLPLGKDVLSGFTVEIAFPWSALPGPLANSPVAILLTRIDRTGGTSATYANIPLLTGPTNLANYYPLWLLK